MTSSPPGREQRSCSTALQSLDLPARNAQNLVVLDSRGNPLVVSGVVVYHVSDTYKATVATENYRTFIETQSEAVLKNIVGMWTSLSSPPLHHTPSVHLPPSRPRIHTVSTTVPCTATAPSFLGKNEQYAPPPAPLCPSDVTSAIAYTLRVLTPHLPLPR